MLLGLPRPKSGMNNKVISFATLISPINFINLDEFNWRTNYFLFLFFVISKIFYTAIVCTGIMSKVKKKKLPTMNHSKIRDKLIVKASVIRL